MKNGDRADRHDHDWVTCPLCRRITNYRASQWILYRARTAGWCEECRYVTGHAPDCEAGRWLRLRRGRKRVSGGRD